MMDPVEAFAMGDEDHLEHPGMTVEVELRNLDVALLKCSCGQRMKVPAEWLDDYE
jgi:hypothetical protein